jgi:hypothetical protein
LCSTGRGRSPWELADVGGDPIADVLTERVSDAHPAGLHRDAVSSGNANGSFLRAGLVDEIGLAIFPAVDGTKGAPCVFDSCDEEAGAAAQSAMARTTETATWRISNGDGSGAPRSK